MRLLSFLSDQPWAITEGFAQRMLEIYYVALERKARGEELDKKALEKELGRPLDNTHTVTIRDGVATIPVEGPIFRRADMFTEISGATTVETLAKDFNEALSDPNVSAIVLYVDSPGGEVNGVNEFSDMIYAARGQKPVVSYVAHLGASAACWIATAADSVVIDATASMGSIGVIAAVRDPTKENKREIEFVSSQSPNKRPDPTKEAGKAQIQSFVDDLAQVFVDTVARNRNVSAEKVVSDFGSGALLVGQKAVDAGLADRVGSYEQVLAELQGDASGVRASSRKSMRASSDEEKTMAEEEKGWWAKFLGALTGDERKKALAMLSEGDGAPPQAGESDEIKALRARAARYEAQARAEHEKAAVAYAGELVLAKRIMPASQAKAESLLKALADDDYARPVAEGQMARVDQFKALCADLPKHTLCTEMVASDLPDGAMALNPDAGTQDDVVKAAAAAARAYAERTNPKLREVR